MAGRRILAARASTSGTTGVPLRLLRSPRSVAVEQAAIDHVARTKGVDLSSARVAVLRGDDLPDRTRTGAHWIDVAGGRRRVFASNELDTGTAAAFAEALDAFAPDCLLAYPTVVESLCRFLEADSRSISVPLTLTSSETLTAATRALVAETLRTEVVDYYGQAERVTFAYDLGAAGYRFLPGYGFTELIPAAEGDGLHEIVGTSFWNLAMPLIRYRTGDLVRLDGSSGLAEIESICHGIGTIQGIGGRSGDFLLSPSGGRLMGIDHIPRDVANVLRVQVVQETRTHVRILVLPKEGFGDADREHLAANAARKLPPTMTWSIEVVDALERTPALKAPFVLRRATVDGAHP